MYINSKEISMAFLPVFVKFVFSKKNLKKSSHLLNTVKSTVKISSNIVAFLENTNFMIKSLLK